MTDLDAFLFLTVLFLDLFVDLSGSRGCLSGSRCLLLLLHRSLFHRRLSSSLSTASRLSIRLKTFYGSVLCNVHGFFSSSFYGFFQFFPEATSPSKLAPAFKAILPRAFAPLFTIGMTALATLLKSPPNPYPCCHALPLKTGIPCPCCWSR